MVPSPLPVAAARHPAYLKKLKSSNFVDTSLSNPRGNNARESLTSEQAAHSYASTAVADTIENERATQQTLSAVLSKAKRVGLELAAQLEALKNEQSKPIAVPSLLHHPHNLSMDINFEVRLVL